MTSQERGSGRLAISFDVEHWHQATLLRDEVVAPVDRIEESVALVLDVLDAHETRATFFVVGEVASAYPDLVDRIGAAGHELASHGHTHTPLSGKSAEWLERELSESREAIADASGVEPLGFRAPNFSVTRETEWAFPVLASSGYRYDSSVFPVRTPMYGVSGAPTRPYVVDPGDPFRPTEGGSAGDGLVEFPLSVLDSWLRVPVAGGFYARVEPVSFIEYHLAACVAGGVPATLYFHPWEFNPAVRTGAPGPLQRFVSFHGIDRLQGRVERLLERFAFGAVGDVLGELGLLETGRAVASPSARGTVDGGSGRVQ